MLKIPAGRCFIALSFFFLVVNTEAQNITTPRTPSPAATVSQTIGISTVSVTYSRPAVKGREVWGKLVPYGYNKQAFGAGNAAPWRAGANENTVIRLSHPATIEGHPVPAGEYGLFFVINQDNTGEVILSKDSRSWGSFWYNADHDLFRAKIALKEVPMTEMLTYDFQSLSKTTAELDLNWEKKQFPVKIEFDVDAIVMANAVEELKGPVGFNWQGFAGAANYALANKVNLPQAMVWIDRAILITPNFTTLSTKARLTKLNGNAAQSDSLMKEAVVYGSELEINAYGYQLLNDKEFDRAIEVFVVNTQKHPKSANTFDSLGEAYALKGDKKNAIVSFKKSLTLNPPEATRQNSEKYLQQLGGK
jgi:tetratricopeptide (TPR) repeat protein